MSISLWMSQDSKAQRYREKYTDLVTIQNEQQTVQLTDMVNDDSTDLAWIGFYDDLNSWKWTLEDSVGEKDICYYIYVIYSRDICYYIYTVCVCVCVCVIVIHWRRLVAKTYSESRSFIWKWYNQFIKEYRQHFRNKGFGTHCSSFYCSCSTCFACCPCCCKHKNSDSDY